MKIAVIDDERPSRSELCHLIHTIRPEAELFEADCGEAAIELAGLEKIDIFFLDIHLGDIPGISLAPVIQRMQPNAKIVFATAYDSYAVKAFDLDIADYLMKPFDPNRVEQCLQKLLKPLEKPTPSPSTTENKPILIGKLVVPCNKRSVVIPVESLAYIETDSHSCILHTTQGDFTTNLTLTHFEKRLESASFFRIHKSYLVNLDYISELVPWVNNAMSVKLRNYENLHLPVGRKQLKPLRDLFET